MGMIEQQLAEAVGAGWRQMSKYENPAKRVNAVPLFLMARALEVPHNFFSSASPPMTRRLSAANLRSAADAVDDEAEQQRQAKEEQEGRPAEAQQLRDTFRGATEEKGFGDPFGYSDLGEPDSLGVLIRKLLDGALDWEETAADMLAAIASPADTAETAANSCVKRDTRDTLEQTRQADRSAWSAVAQCLNDRHNKLWQQRNE